VQPARITSAAVAAAPSQAEPAPHLTAAVEQKPRSSSKSFPIILLLILLGGGGAWFYKNQLKQDLDSNLKTEAGAPANPLTVEKASEELPTQFQADTTRPALPEISSLTAHYSADIGIKGFQREEDSKAYRLVTQPGSPVHTWHDLAAKGGDTPMMSYQEQKESAPVLALWKHPLLKADTKALHFGQPSYGTAALSVHPSSRLTEHLPLGQGSTGLTLACALQADADHLPCRILRIATDTQQTLLLRVDEKHKLILDALDQQNQLMTSITADDVDACEPLILILHWKADSRALSLTVRSATGSQFQSPLAACSAFSAPLRHLHLGDYMDEATQQIVPSAQQFHGYLAELALYHQPLRTAELNQLETALAQHYFSR
jgi:hypothetical protein